MRPEELEGEALLLLGEAHCFRQNALAVCEMVGAHPHAGIHGTSFATLVAMVRGGLGLTLLPALAIDAELTQDPTLRLRPFAAPTPARTLGLVWRSGSPRILEFETVAGALRDAAIASAPAVDAGVELV